MALTDFFNSLGSEFYIIGATARDIVLAGIHDQHPGRETGILQTELDSEEGSLLISQILETHSYLKYEEVYDALNAITLELSQ
jgi:hypothetical protein